MAVALASGSPSKNKRVQKSSVLGRISLDATNTMTIKQVGEGRIYSAYSFTMLFITEEIEDRNSNRHYPRGRSLCRGHEGVMITGLLNL